MSDIGTTPAPEQDESYWLRQKLNLAVRHLRDIEDHNRSSWAGLPERFEGSFQESRANRARSIYEQITSDFFEGKIDKPTMKQQLETAVDQVKELIATGDAILAEPLPWANNQVVEDWDKVKASVEELTDSKNAGWAIAQARLKIINSMHENLTDAKKINSEYHTLFHAQDAQIEVLTKMLTAAGISPSLIEVTLAAATEV